MIGLGVSNMSLMTRILSVNFLTGLGLIMVLATILWLFGQGWFVLVWP
jgi:hypothetical protein